MLDGEPRRTRCRPRPQPRNVWRVPASGVGCLIVLQVLLAALSVRAFMGSSLPSSRLRTPIYRTDQPLRSRRSFLEMGKGDGKKKRKKKSASAPGPSSAAADVSASSGGATPLRVTSDSNISVKQQIRWAKMNKEYQRSGTAFRQKKKLVRTKYRRSWDEEEIEEKKVERSKRGKEPDWDVILSRSSSSPLFIVDGYNVIHKWPRLKKWMAKGSPSRARDILVHDLEELRRIKGWRIECVFDGGGKASNPGPLGSGPGSIEVNARIKAGAKDAVKAVTSHGIRIVYSGAGQSADSYIENRCFEAKKVTDGEMTGSLIVASDDNMIRLAGTSAGALCMSSQRLVDELKATRASVMHRVEVAVAEANGHGVRPSALHGTAAPGRFTNKMTVVDKRKRKSEGFEGEDVSG